MKRIEYTMVNRDKLNAILSDAYKEDMKDSRPALIQMAYDTCYKHMNIIVQDWVIGVGIISAIEMKNETDPSLEGWELLEYYESEVDE